MADNRTSVEPMAWQERLRVQLVEAHGRIDWGSEQGLFWHNPDADRDEAAGAGGKVRNLDFLRLKDEAVLLCEPAAGKTVLEVGCGSGPNLVMCGLLGAHVLGQDLSVPDVELANAKFAQLGIDGDAEVGDCTHLTVQGTEPVDVVLSSDFHEHLTAGEQAAVLAEAWRVLVPGGVLVIKTPNLAYLRASLAYKRVRAIAGGRSPLGMVIPHTPGTSDPQHVGLVDRATLAAQLVAAGFDHHEWRYPPLRRFGAGLVATVLSSEVPGVRDVLCEDLLVRARKPIAAAFFDQPDTPTP